jgi:hypothetical protein
MVFAFRPRAFACSALLRFQIIDKVNPALRQLLPVKIRVAAAPRETQLMKNTSLTFHGFPRWKIRPPLSAAAFVEILVIGRGPLLVTAGLHGSFLTY